MLFDVTRYDGYPVSADFRLYLRAEIKRSKRFPAYRERSGCPPFARMSRDDLIAAVHGCDLNFGDLFNYYYHRKPERAVTRKFRTAVAQIELTAAREMLGQLGYMWCEKSGKWQKSPVW